MEYSRIIAVTSLPGLYELISSKSDGGIVRSLEDKTTKFVSSRIHQFSHLESIEVYTTGGNVNLVEVLQAMDKAGEKLPDEKSPGAIKKYFDSVYPDLDFTRVYNSDLKKMIKWFVILRKNEVELKLSEPEPETEEVPAEEPEAAQPAKKEAKAEMPAAKKEAPKKTAKEPEEKAPAKAVAKKETKAEAATEKPAAKKDAPKKAAKEDNPAAKAPAKPAAKKDDGKAKSAKKK